MVDLGFLRDGIVELLGEEETVPAVLIVGGREIETQIAFRKDWAPAAVAGVAVKKPQPAITMKGEDWDANGAHVGAQIRIRGTLYTIASETRNDADLVVAPLRVER